jgi:hypothetical protein
MEVLTQHLQEHWRAYLFAAIIIIPLLIVFRRWAIPALQYGVELAIYLAVMHVLVGGVVVLAAWFKDQSTMKRARDLAEQNYNPGWTTPFVKFWDYGAYNPQWILYLQVILAIGIIFLMWKYRPMQLQKRKKKPAPPKKRPGMQYFSNTGTGGRK